MSILFLESVLQQDRNFGVRVKGCVNVGFVNFLHDRYRSHILLRKGELLTASAPWDIWVESAISEAVAIAVGDHVTLVSQ